MFTFASALFGNPVLVVIVLGAITLVMGAVYSERCRLRRQWGALHASQEKLADDLWQLKAASEARARAEALAQAKGRFVATVSHEVRTPLNGILGMAELLGATPLDPEQQAYLDAIQSSGRSLAALIDEVLDFSAIEAGRMQLASDPFDVQALVEGVVELLGPRAQEKGLEIAALIDADVPLRRLGDPARLRQILINLAGNAVKFTGRGGVGVRIARAGDGELLFTVADTGPGVPAGRRAAIFEEFERGDRSGQTDGTGLGLSIARRLVGLMGGALTLSDRPGGGTVFSFQISLALAEDAVEAPRLVLPDLKGKQALIVADSPFQAPFMAQTLGQAGAKIVIVAGADEAAMWLGRDTHVDLLIVDCALGEAALAQVAGAATAHGVDRSLLLFSPSERRAFGQKRVEIFDGWLVKPVRARSLVTRVAPQPAEPAPVAKTPLVEGPAAEATDMWVLLAEDNEINTLVMLKMLDRIGASVIHVTDGALALSAALAAMRGETRAFDAILLDISMPGLNGQEAARLLRRAERGAGATPTKIVALTAYAFEDDRQACFDAGIDEFLTKPIDLVRLRAALAAETDPHEPGSPITAAR